MSETFFHICDHLQFTTGKTILPRCLIHAHEDCLHRGDYRKCHKMMNCKCSTPFLDDPDQCRDAE